MAQLAKEHRQRAVPPEEEASRRHYDRWRGAYSRSRLLASLQRRALEELDLRRDDCLLDVACGAGKLVRAAAPQVARAVGVDLSSRMIEEACAHPGDDGDDRAEFVVGSSDRLPFGDAEFTAVVTTTAFHHFPDPVGSVREIARVLTPGGRVLIGDATRDTLPSMVADAVMKRFERGHVGLQKRKGFERLLTDAGLRVTRSESIWFGLYALVVGEEASSDPRTVTELSPRDTARAYLTSGLPG